MNKKGDALALRNMIVLIILILVLVWALAGPLKSSQLLGRDLGEKSSEFGESFKALEIERLLTIDKDKLSDEERELLESDEVANAKSSINLARKYIDESRYEDARQVLTESKESLDSIRDFELLNEIDSLVEKTREYERQAPWEEELEVLEQRYSLYKGTNEKEKLEQLRFDVLNFMEGKYGRIADEANDLLKSIETDLKRLGVSFVEGEANLISEYELLITTEGEDYEYLSLAREFVEHFPTKINEIFNLYKHAEEKATDDYTKAVSILELATFFYNKEMKSNAAYEYNRIYADISLKSSLSSEDLKTLLRNRGLLLDEGYSELFYWDFIAVSKLTYKTGIFSWTKIVRVNFPFNFHFKDGRTTEVSKFNSLFDKKDFQTFDDQKKKVSFFVDYWKNIGAYSSNVRSLTDGNDFRGLYDGSDNFDFVVRLWGVNQEFLGWCAIAEDSTKPLQEYLDNNIPVIGKDTRGRTHCIGANGNEVNPYMLVNVMSIEELDDSSRITLSLELLKEFKPVKPYELQV